MDPVLRKKVVSRIKMLRRYHEVDVNWPALRSLVEENLQEISDTFSARWLISICDTYVDHGGPIERRNAMMVSVFANMIRLGDTVVRMRGPVTPEGLLALAETPRPFLFSEMRTLHLNREDTFLNMAKRLTILLAETPVIASLYLGILRIVHAHENVVTAFMAQSTTPDWVLPIEPLGMGDNRGITHPPIERRLQDEARAAESDHGEGGP